MQVALAELMALIEMIKKQTKFLVWVKKQKNERTNHQDSSAPTIRKRRHIIHSGRVPDVAGQKMG
jgi:hypothetical protein